MKWLGIARDNDHASATLEKIEAFKAIKYQQAQRHYQVAMAHYKSHKRESAHTLPMNDVDPELEAALAESDPELQTALAISALAKDFKIN